MAVSVAGATNNAPLVVAQNNTATIETSLQGSMSTPVFLISNFSSAAGAYGLSVNGHSSSTPAIGGGNDSTGIGFRGLSTGGIGAQGTHTGTASDADAGVEGQSSALNGTGVKGIATNGGQAKAVYGVAGSGYGGYFSALQPGGYGVYADGYDYGSIGTSESGTGVLGTHRSTAGTAAGVEGYTNSTAANAVGVLGRITSTSPGANSAAVRGQNNSSGGAGFGVWGSQAGSGTGVYGTSPSGVGVQGFSPSGIGVYGSSGEVAGYFSGNVNVIGTLSKTSGMFKIDHPLDPAHTFLQHSFVESPDMLNVYNGNVTTDGKGFATVRLPAYFQALNRSFRYQLTVIDKAHWTARAAVWDKIANNRFTIRTDQPKVEISWQVTGIRHDRYANANRIKVVVPKSGAEQGKYLHPELYGKPRSKAIDQPQPARPARVPVAKR
jgi:hypothetical protein